MDNLEIEKNAMPTAGEPVAPQTPAAMPTPAPMPEAAPVIPQAPQQPAATPSFTQPEARPAQADIRKEAPMESIMRPIDLSAHEGSMPQMAATANEGKRKFVIIAIVVVAGLIAGVGGFLVWRMMNAPVNEAPVTEQAAPVTNVPAVQPVVAPVVEADAISAIDKELATFNATTVDAEAQNALNAVKAAL